MRIYLVGGAVRDTLIKRIHKTNIDIKDRDYVVVGSTPEEMLERGYTQVGADFPVFLHPITKEEYALARTERKSGSGHTGFDCEWEGVTLMEDLFRRDLTVNSIAMDVDTGQIHDPCNGVTDIHDKVLRLTSNNFDEDPLRVLRLARFTAQLDGWVVAPETISRCSTMVADGSLDHLTPERVWKETEKALGTGHFFNYVETLYVLDYLRVLFPFYDGAEDIVENKAHHPERHLLEHIKLVVSQAESSRSDTQGVFAAFMHDAGKKVCYQERGVAHGHDEVGGEIIKDWCAEWKVPNNYRDLAMLVSKYHGKIHGILGRGENSRSKPNSVMRLFESTAAEKNYQRFAQILDVCAYDAKGRGGGKWDQPYPQKFYLLACIDAVRALDTKSISAKMVAEGKEGRLIGEAIRVAKIKEIRGVYNKWK